MLRVKLEHEIRSLVRFIKYDDATQWIHSLYDTMLQTPCYKAFYEEWVLTHSQHSVGWQLHVWGWAKVKQRRSDPTRIWNVINMWTHSEKSYCYIWLQRGWRVIVWRELKLNQSIFLYWLRVTGKGLTLVTNAQFSLSLLSNLASLSSLFCFYDLQLYA